MSFFGFLVPHRTEAEDRGTRKPKKDIEDNVGKRLITITTELPR
jgi:hypothetical protein